MIRPSTARSFLAASLAIAFAFLSPVAIRGDGLSGSSVTSRIAYFSPEVWGSAKGTNVFLMNGQGKAARQLTFDATSEWNPGPTNHFYRSAAWSHDGRYLLVSRLVETQTVAPRIDMLLYGRHGHFLRKLGAALPESSFGPGWALDADEIAYIASDALQSNTWHVTVRSVGTNGKSQPLWKFDSPDFQGCGGSTSDPAEGEGWKQIGYETVGATLQWSVSRHLAVFNPNCLAKPLDWVDTHTGTVHQVNLARGAEGVLSPSGVLAAVSLSPTRSAPWPGKVVTGSVAGSTWHTIGNGEVPAWAADGTHVYFESQTATGSQLCSSLGFTINRYRTTLFRANADGSGRTVQTVQKAYAFGPPTSVPRSGDLIYSHIGNDQHCPTGSSEDTGSTVTIQALTPTGQASVLATQAGRPSFRP
jgi:hypothetical protein